MKSGIISSLFAGLIFVALESLASSVGLNERATGWGVVGIAIVLLIWLYIETRKEREKIKPDGANLFCELKNIVLTAEEKSNLTPLVYTQFFLRLIVLIILGITQIREETFLWPKNVPVSNLIFGLTILYGVFAYLTFLFCRGHPLCQDHDDDFRIIDKSNAGILSIPSYVDCIVAIVITLATKEPMYGFVVFILPALVAWVFYSWQHVFVICLLLVATILLDGYIEISGGASKTAVFSNSGLLFTLWFCIFLMVTILRTLWTSNRTLRDKMQEERNILRIVTDGIEYLIFMKLKDRTFEFMNLPLKRELEENLKKIGINVSDSVRNKGVTDTNLEIDRKEYKASDDRVLDKGEIFKDFEPSFATKILNEGNQFYTTKTPVIGRNNEVIGLVGIVEPGKPIRLVDELALLVAQDAPYYALLKDREGNFKWVNEQLQEDDLGGMSISEWERANHRKLTDRNLYGEKIGSKYAESDSAALKLGEQRLPASNQSQSDEIKLRPIVDYELHKFQKGGPAQWIKYHKLPWFDSDLKTVKGVKVVFHDVHHEFCRLGVSERWIGKHLPLYSKLIVEKLSRSKSISEFDCLAFFSMLSRLAAWVSQLAGDDESIFPLDHSVFVIGECDTWIPKIIEEMFSDTEVSVSVSIIGDIETKGDFRVLIGALFLMIQNAVESAVSKRREIDKAGPKLGTDGSVLAKHKGKVEASLSYLKSGHYEISVCDNGLGMSDAAVTEFIQMEGKNVTDGKPGGGSLFIGTLINRANANFSASLNSPTGACCKFKISATDLESFCQK